MTQQPIVPLYLGNRKMLTRYYLPPQRLLPPGTPRVISIATPNYPQFAAIAHPGTADGTFVFNQPFALAFLTGLETVSDGSAPFGFRIQLTHVRGDKRITAFSKDEFDRNVLGTGQLPMPVKALDFFDVGDALVVEVKTLAVDALTSRVDLAFHGVLIGAQSSIRG